MIESLERVLLVEDDLALQIVARTALESVGKFKVKVCASGEDALREAAEFKPQLLLLDVMMPRMDGPETLRHLREMPEIADVPAIFMTAKAQSHEVEHYYSLGAVDVVTKPFDPMSLPGRLRSSWNRVRCSEAADEKGELDADRAFQRQFADTRAAFAAELPDRLRQLEYANEACAADTQSVATIREFYRLAHSLTGAAAMLGYSEVSNAARTLEIRLKRKLLPSAPRGELWVRGEVDPFLEVVRRAIADRATGSDQGESPRVNGGRPEGQPLLLVEDDATIARYLTEQLNHFGYRTKVAGSLAELSKLLQQETPAALIMDYELPDGQGAKEVARIRRAGLDIPVVFLTAHEGISERLESMRAGASAYFVKPVNVIDLVFTIDRLTGSLRTDRLRALIVDDSVSQSLLYRSFLEHAGFGVEVVNNPMVVLDKLAEFRPDVILLDVHMEPCDGFEVAAVLRQHHELFDIPIVFLSADADRDIRYRATGLGAEAFLNKSVAPQVLINAVTAHAQRARAIRSMTMRDGLTGLLNHSAIKETLEREVALAARRGSPLAVAMLDLDHFKRVNDSYGHQTGDRVLKSLAQLLTTRLRRSDAIGRYGGEEVMIVLHNTSLAEAFRILEEARKRFAALDYPGLPAVTFSAGVSEYCAGIDASELLRHADLALYAAKDTGRNRVSVFDDRSGS